MRRVFSVFCIVALSACAGAGTGSRSTVPNVPASSHSLGSISDRAATNWNVQTGAATNDSALQDLDFYPNTITIDAGDTITYTVGGGMGGDAHTVSFVPATQKIPSPLDPKDLQPAGGTTIDGTKFVNSGILVGGQTFTATFSKRGTYRILCLFHEPAMESTVIVQKAGAPYPHGPNFYRDVGAREMWDDLGEAQASVLSFPFQPGGTTLAAGIDPHLVHYPPYDSTVLRYLDVGNPNQLATAGNVTIKAGTILTFVNLTSNEPHTITLPLAGQQKLPSIPPDPPVNVVPPPGVTNYDGSYIVNSGSILGGTRFKLRFTKAGSYYYGCLYHDNSGMDGTVTVTP